MKIVFFTGAGISAESGISTFRDSNGLWENHKIDEVCNFRTWEQNKSLVFDFYNKRRIDLKNKEPNLIHTTIANLQKKYGVKQVIVITQNVDDLLERAECMEVLHVHGFLTELKCTQCKLTFNIGYNTCEHTYECEICGSKQHIKPNVVFFGEQAPNYFLMQQHFNNLEEEDLLVVLGTTGNVIDINSVAKKAKSINILNNMEKNFNIENKNFKYTFYEKGTIAIPKIEALIEQHIKEYEMQLKTFPQNLYNDIQALTKKKKKNIKLIEDMEFLNNSLIEEQINLLTKYETTTHEELQKELKIEIEQNETFLTNINNRTEEINIMVKEIIDINNTIQRLLQLKSLQVLS